MAVDFTKGDRLVTEKERARLIPYTQAHWDRLEAAGEVPKRIRIGAHRVAWSLLELQAWAEARQSELAEVG